ncbi:MAG: DUF2113 domain-containing protein [Candidatus Methanolliviera hydrocarbonicum]|uniref:DUF2113 domain-containing protein n=1 Tax=Candidatus Methanolliviera hydrocarbonicum TaxID=2491085 RepID=A0A520KUB1_9EURY|nr:MAG: DUF2113 domain-containing protein [Candidatus Methanolliviera hydrocarbonicum]
MNIAIDSDDEEGKVITRETIIDIVQDLNLTNVIEDVNVFVRPKEPVFIVLLSSKMGAYEQKNVRKNITDCLLRVIPEGFRVRKRIVDNNTFAIIASEDPIKGGWVKKAVKMMRDIQN